VNDRSLRRQFREQGISFRGLLDELRMQIAMKYLRTTQLANEDIAPALGFSDATNFRRAFPMAPGTNCGSHRSTSLPPSAELRLAAPQPAAATIGLIFAGALSAFFDQDR
jgi:transcriptional regulator GlxA family with amidase domain